MLSAWRAAHRAPILRKPEVIKVPQVLRHNVYAPTDWRQSRKSRLENNMYEFTRLLEETTWDTTNRDCNPSCQVTQNRVILY